MNIEDVRIGMKVKANEESNARYCYSTEFNECEGIVREINGDSITLEVTKHKKEWEVGETYAGLYPYYFDSIEEVEGIQISLKDDTIGTITAGDFVLLKNGKLLFIGITESHYRAVDMQSAQMTWGWGSIKNLVSDIENIFESTIIRVIPSSNMKIIEL